MKYELQATLSFESDTGVPVSKAIEELRAALADVLEANPEYSAVAGYMVAAGSDPTEILVGLRFDGVKAKYVEETADEILDRSLQAVARNHIPTTDRYREESVSLQPVLI